MTSVSAGRIGKPHGRDGSFWLDGAGERPSEGDEVEEGQLLCIIEAMKMENEINAHKAGKIAELPITEGEPIKTGDPIATITSPPAEE